MNTATYQIRKKKQSKTITKDIFRNEEGAIDLASIMVGVIVIGLLGGVIAATVFSVIPWTQDNAAKQQLDSVTSAESAYMGLSSANPSPLPTGYVVNSFGNSSQLAAANLMAAGPTYCVSTPADSKSYTAFSQSASGSIFSTSDKVSQPVLFTGTLPTECQFISAGTTPPGPYVDPTPTRTILTYKCNSNVSSGATPFNGIVNGTETWSDGVGTRTYTNASSTIARSFTAGVTYTVTLDGTFSTVTYNSSAASAALTPCLRSIDHWGMSSGTTNVNLGFSQATNLTNVPDHIPTTIKDMGMMFYGDSKLNDPNIGKWDTSNVNFMNSTFGGAATFNQDISGWNTSNVQTMNGMFSGAAAFNQPLNNWNVSKVINTQAMFSGATAFNQPLNNWNVSKVGRTTNMFDSATSFNQPLNNWNVSNVTDMSYMFTNATSFNQNLSGWNTANVATGTKFAPLSFPTAYLPAKTSL